MAANSSELEVAVVVPLQELNHLKNEDNNNQQQQQQKQDLENSSNDYSDDVGFCKCKVSGGTTPDRLKLPKPLNFAERYTSPTDHMMSPISKGILARKTRKGALLPPSIIQSKIQELQ